jgi:hypothetical protein
MIGFHEEEACGVRDVPTVTYHVVAIVHQLNIS